MRYAKRIKQLALLLLIGFAILIFFKGFYIYRFRSLKRLPEQVFLSPDYYDYRGIIHCHSIHSDGSGSIEEIMEAANREGLNFLILTDHNTRQTLKEGREGWYGDCLLLIGEEVSTFVGHYLGLNIPPAAFKFSPQAQDSIDDVNELGGFGIIAHPFSRSKNYWQDWSVERFQGMELINIDSQWRDEPFYRLFWLLLTYKLNPRYILLSTLDYPVPNLTKWDQLTRERTIIGIAGTDAHQNISLFGGLKLKFPSYSNLFSLAQVHILTSQPMVKKKKVDRHNVYSALKRGNCYICIEGLAESSGFIFQAQCQGEKAIMGDELLLENSAELTIIHSFPAEAELKLIKDGKPIVRSTRNRLRYIADKPGIYRVEIWSQQRYLPKGKRFPWIISNPIYLRDKEVISEKAQLIRLVEPTAKSEPCILLLEDFEQFPRKSSFRLEHDTSSYIDEDNITDNDTPSESSSKSLLMSFRLGKIEEGKKEVWCALGERRKRDLSGYKGISFYAKGDKTYRLSFQLREEDAAGGKEKIEQWEISVKIRSNWEKKTILFNELYLVSKNTNGKKELNRVKGIFFILDQSNTHPSTEGKIWLDDICLF